MTITVDCKNEKCKAIFHAKYKTFKKHEIKANCPFCGTKEKIIVGVDDE